MRYLLLLISLISSPSLAQLTPVEEAQVDSLKRITETAKHDTTKIKALVQWDNLIYWLDQELDEELNLRIESTCRENLELKISKVEREFFYRELSGAVNILGNISAERGEHVKASEYYYESYEIMEELNDREGVASALLNIGMLYKDQDENDMALQFFRRALRIEDSLNHYNDVAKCLNNIGVAYEGKAMYDSALIYHSKALHIRDSIGNIADYAGSLNNVANIYFEQGDFSTALDYYMRAYKTNLKVNNKPWQAVNLNNIGMVHYKLKNYNQAYAYALKSLRLAEEIGNILNYRDALRLLYDCAKHQGDYGSALKYYELFIRTRDSILSEENQKEIIRQQYKYEYEKQAASDSVKAAEAAKVKDAQLATEQAESEQHKLEAKQQEQQKYYLFGGLALALLFGGFIFNRFRVTSKQKGIIEEQKQKVDEAYDELEEKNTEILDSINYAKRIQSAILPPNKVVKEYLQESFILYKPKDIVAGDFYWLEHVDDKVLFAACDCTGHGVPGAMVSVVCNNGLNRAVREHGLTDPASILDKTREIVIGEFEKSEEEVKDGMDIALCSLEGSILKYAGAHNPLWIIRKGAIDIEEIKADKQPIGKYAHSQPYTTHTLELKPGDSIYIFSDGYADQFGGEKGKKFKAANFKKLLLSIQDESMERQRELIDEAFENWRRAFEQLDDVCVIGVRI